MYFMNISHMLMKIWILFTSVATFSTSKRLFSSMCKNMFSTIPCCFSNFMAHRTGVFLKTQLNWIILQNNEKFAGFISQHSWLGHFISQDYTSGNSDNVLSKSAQSMNSCHMATKMCFLSTGIIALWTWKWLFSSMRENVPLEILTRLHESMTIRAFKLQIEMPKLLFLSKNLSTFSFFKVIKYT